MSDTAMPSSSELRKREEQEFHDRLRSIHELEPENSEYYLSNKKFYAVTQSSTDFFLNWARLHGTGKLVLDYGCGGGTHAIAISKRVTGIDISPESVRICTERAADVGASSNTEFIVMDGEHTEFPDSSFDLVDVAGVLHHVDLPVALAEIARVLKPDGKGIFLEAIADNPLIHAYRHRTPHLRTGWETEHILRARDALVMRRYFTSVEVRYFHLAVLASVPLRRTPLFAPLRALLNAVDESILRVPGLQRQAWMACFLVSGPRKGPNQTKS